MLCGFGWALPQIVMKGVCDLRFAHTRITAAGCFVPLGTSTTFSLIAKTQRNSSAVLPHRVSCCKVRSHGSELPN